MLLYQKPNKDSSKKTSWIQFFAKGKDSGFSFGEIELLRKLALKNNLEDPSSLFWSQSQLDNCIRSLVKSTRISGEDKQQKTQDFISKLYEYRKKIEFEKPQYRKGINTSRNIEEGQVVRILAKGIGAFPSRVIKNTSQYITILKPSENVPAGLTWNGIKLSVYLWRRDDAGYVFDSLVLDEVFSKGYAALQITHSDTLFRTQKRNSIRVKMERFAFIYLAKNGELSDGPEMLPGLKCLLSDLSENGCAVVIGGQAKPGFRLKVQFSLDEVPIYMNGTVKSVDYNEAENKSLLHVEADPLPLAIKNRIHGEVFGVEENNAYLDPFNGLDDENSEENPIENVGDAILP
jgi:c-di-GMP-binding flagellar brake protein YcgR